MWAGIEWTVLQIIMGWTEWGDQIPVGAEFLDFARHPDWPWPTQAPVQCILGLFPEGKVAGAWC